MVDLYQICLCCVSGFHILFGLGNLFKLPPLYDPSNFFVNGKPGTGSTEVEKLVEFLFGLWYTGSITGVLLMFFWGSLDALCGALICPIYYHCMVSISSFLYFDKYKIPNPAKFTGSSIGIIHAVLASMLSYVFYMSQ
eukprot:TRINITY_DN9843_c1_g1_i1.p1 TRINITY_DN9843_c1_g1~~TRINITY_DN9843_c1_g1_i1.p1  ORF type:complete len:148 (-),score=18.83 TRINITY_DN9843_c1_g1_i1:14-427(-)